MKSKLFRVIGLMSGTSIDGIDAALVETDGQGYVKPLAFMPYSYDTTFRNRLRQVLGRKANRGDLEIVALEKELTQLHADIVKQFIAKLNGSAGVIDLIGFHGQTIWHQPKEHVTIQLGDGGALAKATGIPVVNDFRAADVAAGGQGAPLVPLYHRALAAGLPKPLAIVNIGGVSNITWIGADSDKDIMAFDVGPGNAPLDDWVLKKTGQAFDEYGVLASEGVIHRPYIDKALAHPFFKKKPPKSLDRDTFLQFVPDDMSPADGAATITKIIAYGINHSLKFLPQTPENIYVTGGGRLNHTLMRCLSDLTSVPVKPVDDLGWSGDGLEAEAFAYLAVRSQLGLPLSMPGTTGVSAPLTGGRFHKP